MDKSKNTRKNYGTAYFATAFLAAFFFEFYWIMTDPTNYFMLLGTGFIMIVMGYLTIDSLLKTKADNEALKAEQNEMMLKAQKAIYIATKKNSSEASKRQAQNIKAMEIMMNKMISSQQALLEEKKVNTDDMDSLIEQLSESNEKLAKEVQSAITVNQLVKANADLVKNVKEVLNANTMNLEQTMDLGAYVNDAVSDSAPVTEAATEATDETIDSFSEPDIETPDNIEILNDNEVINDNDDLLNLDIMNEEPMDDATMNAIENEINMEEMARSEALEEITIPDEMTDELDEAMTADNPEEIMADIADDFESDDTVNDDITNVDVTDVDSMNPDIANVDVADADSMEADIANVDVADVDSMEADIVNDDVENIINIGNADNIDNPDIIDNIEDTDNTENDSEDEIEPLDLSSGEIPNRQLTDEEIAALFASI